MHFKQFHWLYIAGFVVVVGVVVGGGFWWINWKEERDVVSGDEVEVFNEVDTADREEIDIYDWKSYSSNYYGFSFRYPNSVEIQDTLGDLYIIEDETKIKILGISKPLLKKDIAEGYPEKSLPILNEEVRDQIQVNNLDIKIFTGTELSGKRRNFAIVRSKDYLI